MLNILSCNVRSFKKNSTGFLPLIDKAKPHVLVLTETWFSPDFQCNIPNYTAYHTVRSDRRSGGSSVYVHNTINSRKLSNFCVINNSIEICSVEILINREPMHIVAVYRPHSGTIENFTDEFETVIQTSRNSRWCLAGDFNLDLMKQNNEILRFVNMLHTYHFFPAINQPTRFSPNDVNISSLLDQIWTNSLSILCSGILSFDQTDHCPTFIQIPININIKTNEKIEISFRVNNENTRSIFRNKLIDIDWSFLNLLDVNVAMNQFTEKLNSLYCSVFPLKSKFIPAHKALNPWINPDLEKLIDMKSTYFELLRMGSITKQENNVFKNKVKTEILKAKSLYYKKVFRESFGNMKATWRILNDIIGKSDKKCAIKSIVHDNQEIYDREEIANVFANYFENVPLELDRNVINTDIDPLSFIPESCVINSYLNEFNLCTPVEIESIIKNLKITKDHRNSVPVSLIRANRDIISNPLCSLINNSLSSGIFPCSLKVASIIPVHKRGDPRIPANYRPISLLPYFSKIFEKIIFSRITEHLCANNILSPFQFGFRRKTSTLDAIIHFTEIIYDSLNSRKSSLNIMIDYSKAFDTVNHSILLRKLERYGICRTPLQYITSYLKDRHQSVRIGNIESTLKTINILFRKVQLSALYCF